MSEGAKRKTGLTANAVKHAKPKEKAYKLSDRDGLYLLVKPTGIRYWRMNYRFGGQQRTLSFGRWPEILLGDAREMLLEARRLLARGRDPLEQAKLEKIAKSIAAANSFEAVAEEWLEKIEKEGRAAITLKKARWLLAQTYPALGKRPISEITAHELLLVLKKVEATKRYDTANRIRSTCSQVFRYAIATARAERDICSDLRGALVTPRTSHRAAITTPTEAGGTASRYRGLRGQRPDADRAPAAASLVRPPRRTALGGMERVRFRQGGLDDPGPQNEDAPPSRRAAFTASVGDHPRNRT